MLDCNFINLYVEGGAVPLHVPGGCVVIASDVTQALQASISYSLKLQATAISQVSHSLTPIPLPRRLRLHPCTCLAPSLAGKLDYQDLTSAADKSSDSTVVEAEAPSASNALDISTGARKIIKYVHWLCISVVRCVRFECHSFRQNDVHVHVYSCETVAYIIYVYRICDLVCDGV